MRALSTLVPLVAAAGLAAAVVPAPARADGGGAPQAALATSVSPGAPRRHLAALAVPRPPKLDGRLDDPEWRRAPVATHFVQLQPDTGRPATYRTEVRVLYTHSHLYVGARMYDPDPARIGRALYRRDDTGAQSDMFAVGLDPYHDRRTGVVFQVSAAGVQSDVYMFDDSNGNSQWNAVWVSKVAIDAKGWTCEIAIPFSQLNFSHGTHTWGLEFARLIARNGEQDRWQPVPLDAGVEVSGWGTLTGLHGLAPPDPLQLTPYVSSGGHFYRQADPQDPFHTGHDLTLDVGGDLTYALGPDWKIDAAINPDFGQVEADPAQVNLSATQLYLTERRPFFLDGVQIFGTGGGGTSLFYTRRIGGPPLGVARDPTDYAYTTAPDQTPIYVAAKVTGRTHGGTSVGVLEAVTAPVSQQYVDAHGAPLLDRPGFQIQPLSNYLVVRAQQDLDHGDSQVGITGTAVDRALTANLADQLTRSAYSGGLDWNLGLEHKRYYLTGALYGSFVQGTPTELTALQESFARYAQRPDAPYLSVDPRARSLKGLYGRVHFGTQTNKTFNFDLEAGFTSPMFEVNDLGFENRADEMHLGASAVRQDNRAKGLLQRWSVGMDVYAQTNFGQDLLGGELGLSGSLLTRGFVPVNFWVGLHPPAKDDRLLRGGPLAATPASVGWYFDTSTDTRQAVRLGVNTSGNVTFIGTHDAYVGGSLELQPLPALSISLGPGLELRQSDAQYVDAYPDPAATSTFGTRYVFAGIDQVVSSVDLRANWTFTPHLSLQSYFRGTVVTGAYRGLEYFLRPGYRDFAPFSGATGSVTTGDGTLTVRAAGSPATDTFDRPSFTFTGLQANVVLRWEYRPGSTIFLVYQLGCGGGVPDPGNYHLGTWGHLCQGGPPEHTVMLKATYWIGG